MKRHLLGLIFIFFLIGCYSKGNINLREEFYKKLMYGTREEIQELINPLVSDEFKFYKKRFLKTYLLQFKYPVNYMIELYAENEVLDRTYKYKGKIKLEIYNKESKILEMEIEEPNDILLGRTFYNGNKFYKYIHLGNFDVNEELLNKELKISLLVIKEDKQLLNFKDKIKLEVLPSMKK